jgi:hypothetical protein
VERPRTEPRARQHAIDFSREAQRAATRQQPLLVPGQDAPGLRRVAVGALQHQPSAARQNAPELMQRGEILRLAAIPERGAEVHDGVEMAIGVRNARVVGAHEPRPRRSACGAPAGGE